jgi:hypothetical protein
VDKCDFSQFLGLGSKLISTFSVVHWQCCAAQNREGEVIFPFLGGRGLKSAYYVRASLSREDLELSKKVGFISLFSCYLLAHSVLIIFLRQICVSYDARARKQMPNRVERTPTL